MRPSRVAVAVGFGLSLALCATPLAAFAQKTAAPAANASIKDAPPPPVEPEAQQALRRMGAYLGTLTAFEITTQTSLDLVMQDGQRITLDGSGQYKVRRPDRFVIDIKGDSKSRRFIYDGKQFTVYAPLLGFYATSPAPPTIGETLDAIWVKFGVSLPLEDLFRWSDPNNRRAELLQSGVALGPATLDGVATDHYAFREGGIDWQIWIQKGDRPLPLKLAIIDRTDPANPAYVARLSWNVNPTLTADDFTFRPAKDAKAIRFLAANQ